MFAITAVAITIIGVFYLTRRRARKKASGATAR
jgi:hypothetical protein